MLTTVQGTYHNGYVELTEQLSGVPEGTPAIITFVRPNDIDLLSQGISKEQSQVLKANLASFADDWNSPEMNIYDNYDAATANH
jgi:hypothetical protein